MDRYTNSEVRDEKVSSRFSGIALNMLMLEHNGACVIGK